MKNLCIALVTIFASSCSPKMFVDSTIDGYDDRSYSKLAVVGIGKDLKARIEFEEAAVELFRKKGINAHAGIDFFHANMTKEEQTARNYMRIIKENNIDGVITMSLVDTDEIVGYEGGEKYVVPAGYSRFGMYYVQRYATISSPGYFTSSKKYLIEAVLYNLKGDLYEEKDTFVWKGQSSLVDPLSSASAAKSFTRKMVEHMVKEKIVTAK